MPPGRGGPTRILVVAASVIVAVAVGLAVTSYVPKDHRQAAAAGSSSAVALRTPKPGPSAQVTPTSTETPPAVTPTPTPTTPTSSPSPDAVLLPSCASLAGKPSDQWVPLLNSFEGGCTLNGKTGANFSVLPCDAKVSLYTSTAPGTWYWGETGQVFHAESMQASTGSFVDAYRHCVGFNTTRCLTADQALALISRDRPGSIQLLPPPSVGYRCVDGWAFVDFYPIPEGNGGTEVLHVEHDEWIEGDRLLGCGDGTHPPTMPVAIRNGGCGG